MATPQLRPNFNHFLREGAVTSSSHRHTAHPHLNLASRAATSLSVYRPHKPITRAKSFPGAVSLPSLTGATTRHLDEVSLGDDARRSALRSLANNPKLAVSVLNGRVSIVSRESSPLFSKGFFQSTSRGETGEREVPVSRESYHTRSRSPTYQALLLAKSQIEVLLLKKLREIGDCERCLQQQECSEGHPGSPRRSSGSGEGILHSGDCMESRQSRSNSRPGSCSSPCSDYWAGNVNDDTASHLRRERMGEEDYGHPVPKRPISFGPGVLRENIGNKNLLKLDEEEVARRLRKWKNENSTNLPILERVYPEVKITRPCHRNLENEPDGEERFLFLKRTNRRVVPVPARRVRKSSKKKRSNNLKKSPVTLEREDTMTKEKTTSLLPVVGKEPPAENGTRMKGAVLTDTRDPPLRKSLKGLENDVIQRLINPASSQSVKPVGHSIDPNPVAEDSEEEEAAEEDATPLTAKEKFIRMQGRMADIKREKREKMTSFADYSLLLVNKKRAQMQMKGLGSNLSKRLENMTVFQSSSGDLSGDENDDDDDDDHDGALLMDIPSDSDDHD